MTQPEKLIFLPGAGGNGDFWQPLAGKIVHPAEKKLLDWPGFGGVPKRADILSVRFRLSARC